MTLNEITEVDKELLAARYAATTTEFTVLGRFQRKWGSPFEFKEAT